MDDSNLPVSRTLRELDVPRSSFYRWYRAYQEHGYDGLADHPPDRRRFWNRIPQPEQVPGFCENDRAAIDKRRG